MSDTSAKTVSMNKSQDKTASGTTSSTGSGGGAPVKITPPLTVNLLCWALGLMVVLNFAQAFLLLGWTDQLKAYVIRSNANAKTPQDPFDAVHAVYQLRQGAFITAVLYGVMLTLLIFAFRRTRSASASRWAVLIIFLYTLLPFRVIPAFGEPIPVQIAGVAVGVLSILALALIFFAKDSIAYFRACREANVPPERRGQQRPGLSSLFAPRPPRQAATSVGRTAQSEPARRPAETRPAVPKAKAKVRTDSEAIAKGADLARARAKASKSRRTTG